MGLHTLLVVGSSLTFLAYGTHCLCSASMRSEFARYGLSRLRILTGVLEILGGVGLIVGLWWPLALQVSSAGLALLMLCGILARIHVRDAAWRWVPASVLLLVNSYILAASLDLSD